jgi:putative MATE family efflux protein
MTSNRNIFNISYPIFLTLIAQNIINVTDTAFLGRVGEVEMGAAASGGVFYSAIYVRGFGFSMGAQILIGRRNGEKNYAQIGPIFNNGLLFNFLLGLVLFVLAWRFMPMLMTFFVSSEQVYQASLDYLDWRIFGVFFSFINVMFRAFFVGITKTRVLTVSAVITALTNALFNYLLIFGHGGFPALGIVGAGIAAVIAEAVTFLYLAFYLLTRGNTKQYGLFQFKKIDFRTIRQILDLSLFIMFQFLTSVAVWFSFFAFVESMGERPLAVSNIGRSLCMLLMISGSALATTTSTLVSNLIGAGQKEQVIPLINKMIKITLVVMLPVIIFAFIFPELFARIYTNDLELIEASIPVIQVVAVSMIACAVGNIIFNALSGTGNVRTACAIDIAVSLIYLGFTFYTTIINPQTVAVVWLSEFVYWKPIGVLSYWYLLKGNWRKKEI